jgi:hypothetical protein
MDWVTIHRGFQNYLSVYQPKDIKYSSYSSILNAFYSLLPKVNNFDFRGHGSSKGSEVPSKFEDLLNDLSSVVSSTDSKSLHYLFAVSSGCIVALHLLLDESKNKDSIVGVVLSSPPFKFGFCLSFITLTVSKALLPHSNRKYSVNSVQSPKVTLTSLCCTFFRNWVLFFQRQFLRSFNLNCRYSGGCLMSYQLQK